MSCTGNTVNSSASLFTFSSDASISTHHALAAHAPFSGAVSSSVLYSSSITTSAIGVDAVSGILWYGSSALGVSEGEGAYVVSKYSSYFVLCCDALIFFFVSTGMRPSSYPLPLFRART